VRNLLTIFVFIAVLVIFLLLGGVTLIALEVGFWKFLAGIVILIILATILTFPFNGVRTTSEEYKLVDVQNGSFITKTYLVLEKDGHIYQIEFFNENVRYEIDYNRHDNYTRVVIETHYDSGFFLSSDGNDLNDRNAIIYPSL
jgi:hypothetical protein